jgi:3',5'-cyclic AMP phosphodiesterase CpdA
MFGESLRADSPDMILITGDIAESDTIEGLLSSFAEGVGDDIPVAFVLGNHDHYRGSIAGVHKTMRGLRAPNLIWMDDQYLVDIGHGIAMVGQYAWYDGGFGNPMGSQVLLYDFSAVRELRERFNQHKWIYEADRGGRNRLLAKLRSLAADAAEIARRKIVLALSTHDKVLLITHVAPFSGASWHEGEISNPDWLPWFSCKAMGRMLERVADDYPDKQILVLCGHSHSAGRYQHRPNLLVLTGPAEYGYPVVAAELDENMFEGWDEI